jgi:hypothetical protein
MERVTILMGRIIPTDTIKHLESLELATLILSTALHDIGIPPKLS